MGKQDFLQLDSPLLGWMKDYDAMASVLKSIPILSNITGEQLDFVIDNFQREEYARNEIIATAEEQVSRVTVVRQGTVACLDEDGREMVRPSLALA